MEGTTAKQLEKKSKQKQREMDSVLGKLRYACKLIS